MKKINILKLEILLKLKTDEKFFKNVNSFLNKDKKIELQMDQIVTHYDRIFNETLNIEVETLNEVKVGISDIIIDNFKPIEVNSTELTYALKNSNLSKVVGDDGHHSIVVGYYFLYFNIFTQAFFFLNLT